MGWHFSSDVDTYAELVGPLLAADPVANTVPLTILGSLRGGGPVDDGSPEPNLLGWYGAGGGTPSGAVLMTPPFELILAVVTADGIPGLVEALRANDVVIPGVTGAADLAAAFAAAWTAGTTQQAETRLRMRLYACDALVPLVRPPGGRPRLATESDVDLAVAWFHAFLDEVGGHEPAVASAVRARVAGHRVWLWDDPSGTTVSMAARQKTTVGVARVGPVYTPPEHRRSGYGAAVTAACTEDALREADQVVLFTDLANATSNAIYQQIGYRSITDRAIVGFVEE